MALLGTSCGQVPLMMDNSISGNSLDEPIFALTTLIDCYMFIGHIKR